MNINRNNYQEYFLEYYENMLDPGQVAELMVFLEANPDLNEAFEAYEQVRISPESVRFDRKKILKKKDYTAAGKIDAFNYEEYMAAGIEGDLTPEAAEGLNRFLEMNPEARLEYDLFHKTILVPDDINFEHKEVLHKKSVILLYRTEIRVALAIAASILAFLAFFLQSGDEKPAPEIVKVPESPVMQARDAALPAGDEMVSILPREGFPLPAFINDDPLPGSTMEGQDGPLTPMAPVKVIRAISKTGSSAVFVAEIPGRSMHSRILENPAEQEPENARPTFAGRFLKSTVTNLFGERSTNDKKSFLEYTVSGFNMIADRDVEVEKKYDAYGRVVAYNVNGEMIKIGRKVNPPMAE